jgi:hypothetical protein
MITVNLNTYLKGLVNKHNVRYCSEDNPHVTIETVMKSPKLNVWCTLLKNQLIGPFFFEDDTVDGENFLSMLQNFFLPEVIRFVQLFFNRMGHLLTFPVMYDNIWIISFLKGGLGGLVRFGGLHAHRI